MFRIAIGSTTSPVRHLLLEADVMPGHDLVGEEIVVPEIIRRPEEASLDYRTGIITHVHSLSADTVDLLTIEIDDSDVVYIDLATGRTEIEQTV